MCRLSIACLLLGIWLTRADAALREEQSLNGQWECVKVADLDAPVPTDGWQQVAVPGTLSGYNYERAWFRRTVTVPAGWQGRRVQIEFAGARWNSRVSVNGRRVGDHFGGFEPFVVDVTDAVRFGPENELLVGVHDWSGVFTDREADLAQPTDWVRELPRDKVLYPIGGLTSNYGLWDDVTLRALPSVYVRDLFVRPSVQRRRLDVDVTIANDSAQEAEVQVVATAEDGGTPALELPGAPLRVAAGQEATVTLGADWAGPHLWSHLDPHLYDLRTRFLDPAGTALDELRTRFGFREIRIEGPDFVVNGQRLHLLATSWWPPEQNASRAEIERQLRAIKACGCTTFRTHTQPWPRLWYEVADEVGVMMIPEGAVWNDDAVYRVDDPRFWDNYAGQLTGMVRNLRNHPSVIMWSLENEMQGGRVVDGSPSEAELARMGRLVKAADPTRPITYESDGDPGGETDVFGLHYPHEYPEFTLWPNEADWLDHEIPLTWAFTGGTGRFLWDRRKPLYIGEFLWVPSSDPSGETVWFGDVAYSDYLGYHHRGKAESWRQQILGYRRHGVSGISPWTVIECGPLDDTNPCYRAHQYAYQPLAAYPREYDHAFFGGERLERTLDVLNDSLADALLDIQAAVMIGETEAATWQDTLRTHSGDHGVLTATLDLPAVTARTAARLVIRVDADGRRVFREEYPISLFPREGVRAPAGPVELLVYDPRGTLRDVLPGAPRLERLEDLRFAGNEAAPHVLVIAPRALAAAEAGPVVIGRVDPARAAMHGYVEQGGRVLVLEQDVYPEGLLPASLTATGATMTFPQVPSHPALAGIAPEDLKYWRGDHLVVDRNIARPAGGGAVPIVVSGSAAGIASAPLLELPRGRGAYLLCQLKVVSKLGTEPVAGRVLQNLLDYSAGERPGAMRTVVVATPEVRDRLRSMGLRESPPGPPGRELIVVSDPATDVAALRDRMRETLEAGGNVLLHRLTPEQYAALGDLADPRLRLTPHDGPALRAEGEAPLLDAITREDLYWLGRHTGISWTTTPLKAGVASFVFDRTLEGLQVTEYDSGQMKLAGAIVQPLNSEPAVIMASAGSGTVAVDFPADGTYVLGIVARGTPCDGVYPLVDISVDGARIGTIATSSDTYRTYTTFGHVAAGRHEVTVAFINDASNPPLEDRNFYLQKLLVARDPEDLAAAFLTKPAAVAAFRRGRGWLVVDEVNWHTEEDNAQKAQRYICGLLTALGAEWADAVTQELQCATWTPQPGAPYLSLQGGIASLACNSYIETEVTVARAGQYAFDIVARGSSAAGQYPIVRLDVNGQPAGEVGLLTASWRAYGLPVTLPEGQVRLRLSFTNDLNQPPEDRNLELDKVIVQPEG